MTVGYGDLTVDWLGYATARIASETVVYTDPGRYGVLTGEWEPDTPGVGHPPAREYDARDGDVVLVTHDHHYDSDGVRRVASDDATVVVYENVDAERTGRDVEVPEELPYEVERVAYGDELTVNGVEIGVIPAYNDPEGPRADSQGNVPHPEGFGCGFLFTLGGEQVLWTGDSDVLGDHRTLDVSLFVPPIGKSFTMNRHDAADLAEEVDPDLVVPIHYNTFEALEADSGAFAADVAGRGIPVALDER